MRTTTSHLNAAALAMILLGANLSGTSAAEQQVHFEVEGQRVDGTLRLPDDVPNPPVVLILNGFGGTRADPGSEAVPLGLMGGATKQLEAAGFASFIIDFRGTGTSEGAFKDITIDGQIADATAALRFLQDQDNLDASQISLIGYSLGGVVSTALAGGFGDEIKSVVLWNPGINPPAAFTALLGLDQIRKALAAGQGEVQLMAPTGVELTFRGTLFESLYRIVPAAELANYRGPVLVAVGTNDELVFPQPASAEALLSYHHGEHTLWVEPVDHAFDMTIDSDGVSSLLDATISFLSEGKE